jgi:predicted amidohydrolase
VSLRGRPVLVFVRTKQRVDRLVAHLTHDGFHAAGIHHEHTVAQRRRNVERFTEYVEEVNASDDKLVLLPRLKRTTATPKEEIDGEQEREESDDANEARDESHEEHCKFTLLPPLMDINNFFFPFFYSLYFFYLLSVIFR